MARTTKERKYSRTHTYGKRHLDIIARAVDYYKAESESAAMRQVVEEWDQNHPAQPTTDQPAESGH